MGDTRLAHDTSHHLLCRTWKLRPKLRKGVDQSSSSVLDLRGSLVFHSQHAVPRLYPKQQRFLKPICCSPLADFSLHWASPRLPLRPSRASGRGWSEQARAVWASPLPTPCSSGAVVRGDPRNSGWRPGNTLP